MNNIKLLEYSKKNPEGFLDNNYIFIEKHPKFQTFINKTQKIKNLLITINGLQKKKESKQVLEKYYSDLQKEIKNNASYSEFVSFVNACDTNINEILDDIEILIKVTNLYLQNRNLNDIVPSEWIQALIDKGASRRKGKAGEKKLIDILTRKNYKKVKTINDFKKNKKAVAQFAKNGAFSISNVKENFGIKFGSKTQGKQLDLIIKNNDKLYFLEAKHIHVSGGAQDKQIKELIDIIKESPQNVNHFYVSFLDGRYFNKIFLLKGASEDLTKEEKNKAQKQRKDIEIALKKNKNNFFINTTGFKKLFN